MSELVELENVSRLDIFHGNIDRVSPGLRLRERDSKVENNWTPAQSHKHFWTLSKLESEEDNELFLAGTWVQLFPVNIFMHLYNFTWNLTAVFFFFLSQSQWFRLDSSNRIAVTQLSTARPSAGWKWQGINIIVAVREDFIKIGNKSPHQWNKSYPILRHFDNVVFLHLKFLLLLFFFSLFF